MTAHDVAAVEIQVQNEPWQVRGQTMVRAVCRCGRAGAWYKTEDEARRMHDVHARVAARRADAERRQQVAARLALAR